MGEIANALRRARNQLPGARRDPPVRGLPPAALGAQLGAAPDAKPGLAIDSVQSQNAAIILDDSANAEACRHLALRLRSVLDARRVRSVAVVSAERGDGKTTVSCDLAIALATLSRQREIALVDLDLRKPAVARYLSLPHGIGLEEVLLDRAALESVRIEVQQPAIDVFPVIRPQHAAHELLVQPPLASLIAELERRYAVVIVDTSPAPLVPDANLILRHVATCVPVVRIGKTRARSFRRLLQCLPREQLVGWILNGERASRFEYRDYYYGEEPDPAQRWVLGSEAQ